MSLPKFQKLYFPALISLVFLPLMCIVYFVWTGVFDKYHEIQRYHVVEVASEPKDMASKRLRSLGEKANIETYRKYEVLTLTGDLKNDNLELAKLKVLVNQLYVKNDTVNGVKVSLTNTANYGAFVDALDILFLANYKDRHLGFDPTGNEIFIIHFAPRLKTSSSPEK